MTLRDCSRPPSNCANKVGGWVVGGREGCGWVGVWVFVSVLLCVYCVCVIAERSTFSQLYCCFHIRKSLC